MALRALEAALEYWSAQNMAMYNACFWDRVEQELRSV